MGQQKLEPVICVACGNAQFLVPEAELRQLGKRGTAAGCGTERKFMVASFGESKD